MTSKEEDEYVRYPILIIPGFMSSGLEVKESTFHPSWNGKLLWLNLASLGLETITKPMVNAAKIPIHAINGTMTDTDTDKVTARNTADGISFPDDFPEEPHRRVQSKWLQHMMLQDDLNTEPTGVQVRAVPGLDGVNYLFPSVLTKMVTYVFGPFVECMIQEGGYTADLNLQAAPWDWRLSPLALEERDQYFTTTLQQIEQLYQRNNRTPVVLLGHSLGAKVAQYLLQFAKRTKGQEWIDTHIYAFMPVSGTHLGVPKAIKQVVLVDHSCLDPFLSLKEELMFGRSLGSTPWMFPSRLPPKSPPIAWIRPQGILSIQVTKSIPILPLVESRRPADRPSQYQMQVCLGCTAGKTKLRTLCTAFVEREVDGTANFMTETFYFTTPPNTCFKQRENLALQFYLREPGLTNSAKDKLYQRSSSSVLESHSPTVGRLLCRLLDLLMELFCCVFNVAVFPLAVINRMTVEASAVLAVSESIPLLDFSPDDKAKSRSVILTHLLDSRSSCLHHRPSNVRQTTLSVSINWQSFQESNALQESSELCEAIATPNQQPVALTIHRGSDGKEAPYHGITGHDFMYKEGLKSYMDAIHELYDKDAYGPQTTSAVDCPPVKRVHAIYGINIPTEVGACYKRNDSCLSTRETINLYHLDDEAKLDEPTARYQVDGGLLHEMPTNENSSGDGTVPYWSLSSVKNWKDSIGSVTTVELPQAEHRKILGERLFHEEVLKFCRVKREKV